MGREQRRYISYLLRLWQAGTGREVSWRASLKSPHTGERTGFPSLEALFAFLRQETGVAPDSDEAAGDIEGRSERRQE
jgi:hypothetical protein